METTSRQYKGYKVTWDDSPEARDKCWDICLKFLLDNEIFDSKAGKEAFQFEVEITDGPGSVRV